MRYLASLLFVLALVACGSETTDQPFAEASSATYETAVTVHMTIEEGGFMFIGMVEIESTQMFDPERYQQIETHTETIGDASRTRIRGIYRDREGSFLYENASWTAIDASRTFEEDIAALKEPLLRLSEHLEQGKARIDRVRSNAREAVYALEDADLLFDAQIGEDDEGTVEVHDATLSLDRQSGMPRTLMINATVTSSNRTSRMDILMERTFESIGTTTVTRIEP